MSRYGSIATIAAALQLRVESADPVDMQTRLNAALSALPGGATITAFDLAGAGDGHTFTAKVTYALSASPSEVSDGLVHTTADSVQVRCYVAGDNVELAVQRTLALTGATGAIFDELLAGASKGTRLMGITVLSANTGLLSAHGLLGGAGLANAIGAGTTVLVGAAGAGLILDPNSLLFDSPADGRLRYRSRVQGTFQVNAGVSLSLAVALSGRLDIVTAPTGVPVVQGPGTTFTMVADQVGYVGAVAIVALSLDTELGLQISGVGGGGSGVLSAAHLMVTPIALQ